MVKQGEQREPYKGHRKKYPYTIAVRVPEAVYIAVMKRVQNKRLKYPLYSDAEVIRKALVKHLKEKGLLDKEKTYL
jgi:hypothetical protein